MRKIRSNAVLNILLVLMMAMLTLSGCGQKTGDSKQGDADNKAEKIVFKITHGVGTDSVYQHSAEHFKELVEKYSNGKVDVQIYPGGQIGSGEKSVQDIQSGIIQATIESVNNMSSFAPSIGVFDMPYLIESSDEFNKAITATGDDLNKKITEESGIRAITWFEQGPRVLGTKEKPINNINDLKGLKIRVPKNPMMLGAFNSWGVNATPIAWDETINALQQGVIDGLELPYGDMYSTKLDEPLKYITEIHYKYDVCAIVISEKWLQSLPQDVQDAIIKAGTETTVWTRGNTAEFIEKAKNSMKANVTLLPAPKDENVWMEKAKADWPKYYDKVGGKENVAKIMEALGKPMP